LATQAGRSVPAAVAVASGGAGVTVMLSGYATGGQLGLPLAAAVAAFAVVGGRHARGAVGVAVVGLFGLLVVGGLFAGLTTQNANLAIRRALMHGYQSCLCSADSGRGFAEDCGWFLRRRS